jgi:hypothetical protein
MNLFQHRQESKYRILELRLVKYFPVFADVVTLDGCSRRRYTPEIPLALARSKLPQVLFHFVQTADFTLIHWLIKASPVQDFHTQSDIRTVAADC